MKFCYEIFERIPRQGPGSTDITLKALAMIKGLPESPKVLDIGCGKGVQTIELAKVLKADITALDNHQYFLDCLEKNAETENLMGTIKTINKSMLELSFSDGTFDLIWCEGAIFIIGFEAGLREWRKFVKTNGYLAVSDLVWLKNNPPDEVMKFWNKVDYTFYDKEYYIKLIENCGYKVIGSIRFPEHVWWESYFNYQEKVLPELLEKYKDDEEITEFLLFIRYEIETYRKYSEYYGYMFYVMQKI